jgi:hypothetical protein
MQRRSRSTAREAQMSTRSRGGKCSGTSATPKEPTYMIFRQPNELTTPRLANRHILKLTATASGACREPLRHDKPEEIRMGSEPGCGFERCGLRAAAPLEGEGSAR